MPRNGANIWSPPAGTLATTLTPANSAAYNAFVTDVAADLNAARPITAGGTGSTTAAGARTALGVPESGTVQPLNANLTSIAALGTAADRIAYTTGVNTWAETAITAAGRALLDDADAAAQRTTLGLGTAAILNTSTDPDFAGVAPTGLATRAAIDAFVDAAVAAIPPATTDYELISRTVISGSPAAVDFVFDPNLYDTIVFHIGNILHNAVGVQLFMRFSSDGGASFDSGSGNYAGAFSSSNAIVLSGAGEAAVYQPYSAELRLHNPVSASQRTQLTGSIVYSDTNTSTVVATNSISAARLAATQTNAARFYWGTGLFSNVGVITCYGVRNS